MHTSSGQSPTPSPDDAPDAIGVEDARKTLPALINAAQNGNFTTIRFDTHCAKIIGIVPGADLAGLPRFGVRDTREKLSALVTSAAGQPSVITRNNKPVALLVSAHAPARPVSSRVLATVGESITDVIGPDGADQHAVRLSTGIASIDHAAAVLRPGCLTLVVGAPGAGASLLVLSAAAAAALDSKVHVLYAASGLRRTDITARIIAARAGVDYQRLRASTLTPAERQQVLDLDAALREAPLLIDDGGGLDVDAIAEVIPAVEGLALVVVDRLQTEAHADLPLSGDRVPQAVRDLAQLAGRHQIPILAALDSSDHASALALGADLVLALSRTGADVNLAITEPDLGLPTTVALTLDAAHARLTNRTEAAPNAVAGPTAEPTRAEAQHTPVPQPARQASQAASAAAPAAAQHPSEGSLAAAESPASTVTSGTGREEAESPVDAEFPALSESEIGSSGVEELRQMIRQWVLEAAELHGGDVEAMKAALKKRAIPNVMELFARSRVGSRYDHTAFPPGLDILKKKSRNGPDEIWEARPKWISPSSLTGPQRLAEALDINGAYLSAFKCHLPIGKLQHSLAGIYDPKTDGVVKITPPRWDHPTLPNPMGDRKEPGPVWITTATLRLLLRIAKLGLCDVPKIHESWVAYSSENLLETLRITLRDARQHAIGDDDDITLLYVKTMYSKFVSTIGESNTNSKMRRPDWMHIIRTQAFANLWWKAHKAHEAGLEVVGIEGTDEIRLFGDWRSATSKNGTLLFPVGRGLTEVKPKPESNKMIGGE